MSLLVATDLVAGYGAHDEILKGVGLAVAAGEIVAVLGPNGAGKSTLLKCVAGLVRARAGRVLLDGMDLAGLKPREVSRRGVAFVPQEANIFPSLTIAENLDIGGTLDRAARPRRLRAVLERMPELAAKRRVRASTLSGGQRQMLAMGMALMVAPKLLLLDEPTAGLSPLAADMLFGLVRSLAADGVAVAMVEQNALRALQVCDRACILVDGRNHREGPGAALLADPAIRTVFLGDVAPTLNPPEFAA
jgi:branched-chain amino acid transport system ATP-binding protein/neutral amino acid transport system ATP-binding protein